MFIQTEHHASSAKQIIATLMLAALLAVFSFSFSVMLHGSGVSMETGCPFTAVGARACPQNLAAAALHHISSYQLLLNAPVGASVAALIIALLILAFGVFRFSIGPPAFQPALVRYSRKRPSYSLRDRETTRWISLLEHSPSYF